MPPRMISGLRISVAMGRRRRSRCAASAHEREHGFRVVAGLHLEDAVVDRAPVDARRAGLQPLDVEQQRAQAFGQRIARRIAGAPALVVLEADVDTPAEEVPTVSTTVRAWNFSPIW